MSGQPEGKIPSLFFLGYVEALVAYREVMQGTLASMLKEYGNGIFAAFGSHSATPLLDAHNPNFLTHRMAAQFLARNRSPNSVRIANAMYKQLKMDRRLSKFEQLLRATKNTALADDLSFYIEHRLRLARLLAEGEDTKLREVDNIVGFSLNA